jgi:hypothetical protein
MSSKPALKLDWCSHEAAKYAVEHWHYSRCMPKSKLAKVGVWEDGKFVGCVIFGVGATSDLVKSYGLDKTQGCELVRVALKGHASPVSRIVSIALKMLKREMPGLRLVVSFADPEQGHVGGIYQAGGWFFLGRSQASEEYIVNGKRWHGRALRHEKPAHLTTKQAAARMDPDFKVVLGSTKYRYLMPLDDEMRAKLLPLAKPYPKRAGSIVADAPAHQAGEGGSIPTPALLPPSEDE